MDIYPSRPFILLIFPPLHANHPTFLMAEDSYRLRRDRIAGMIRPDTVFVTPGEVEEGENNLNPFKPSTSLFPAGASELFSSTNLHLRAPARRIIFSNTSPSPSGPTLSRER